MDSREMNLNEMIESIPDDLKNYIIPWFEKVSDYKYLVKNFPNN